MVRNTPGFHIIDTGKCNWFELEYNEGEMEEPSEEDIQQAVDIFKYGGLEVEIGG